MSPEDVENFVRAEEGPAQTASEEKPSQLLSEEEDEFISDDDSSDYDSDSDSDYGELNAKSNVESKEESEDEEGFEERLRKKLEKRTEEEQAAEEELWNFPPDREHWTEEDLGEHWEDYWGDTRAVGWEPNLVSSRSWEKYEKLWNEGKPGPPADTPYYVPYRKFYPPIPDNHFDIQTPEDVVEELERTEEFLVWYSYLFKDGSTYEGTCWDDLAHGKGVYSTAMDIVRYEGDWFQNMMQGHGVIEADIFEDEPIPDTEEAAEAKAKGQILRSDYMDPFDREWLKMDAEEQFAEHGRPITSWVDKDAWLEVYNEKPEKGHYKYAGQWKYSRFHGCGVYEINGRVIWGKFYFGELLPDPEECTADFSALHAGLAEVAAGKAKMFANKPDGMVRQVKGPFTDPSHPYMYEEEDLWMAPGFINAYYEVPQDWKVYVDELDKEREMWLNSFYKAPFVVPMPPELEYMWSQEDEYIVLGNEPSASLDLNPENVERASERLQGEVILHVPTGRIINWFTDNDGQLRFFYQPITENGEVIPEAIIPLPLGFDEALKEEEAESEKDDGKNKSFLQKVKEAWVQTREEYQKERQMRKEENEKKWKQEDQAREYQRNLRKAERRVAAEIEIEKRRASKLAKSMHEPELDDLEESAQGQLEQVEEVKSSELTDIPQTEEEEEIKENGRSDFLEKQEEVKEDDEDDKKPRSFGKVAMVIMEEEQDGSGDLKQAGFISPTVFASLTLALKIELGTTLKSKIDGVITDALSWRGQLRLAQVNGASLATFSSQKQVSCLQWKTSIRKDLKIRLSSPSGKSHLKALHGSACTHKMWKHNSSAKSSSKWRKQAHHFRADDTSMKPELEFLSLALPLDASYLSYQGC